LIALFIDEFIRWTLPTGPDGTINQNKKSDMAAGLTFAVCQ